MRRFELDFRSSAMTCGKQTVVYHSALTVLRSSSAIVATWPVLPTNVATIFFKVLRERTTLVGFGSFWKTQIVDCWNQDRRYRSKIRHHWWCRRRNLTPLGWSFAEFSCTILRGPPCDRRKADAVSNGKIAFSHQALHARSSEWLTLSSLKEPLSLYTSHDDLRDLVISQQ